MHKRILKCIPPGITRTVINSNETSNVESSELMDSIVNGGSLVNGVINGIVSRSRQGIISSHAVGTEATNGSASIEAGCGAKSDASEHVDDSC